jgi:hypothetical protein
MRVVVPATYDSVQALDLGDMNLVLPELHAGHNQGSHKPAACQYVTRLWLY